MYYPGGGGRSCDKGRLLIRGTEITKIGKTLDTYLILYFLIILFFSVKTYSP